MCVKSHRYFNQLRVNSIFLLSPSQKLKFVIQTVTTPLHNAEKSKIEKVIESLCTAVFVFQVMTHSSFLIRCYSFIISCISHYSFFCCHSVTYLPLQRRGQFRKLVDLGNNQVFILVYGPLQFYALEKCSPILLFEYSVRKTLPGLL